MGTINAIGNLGGFFGQFIVGALIQRTGTPVVGEAVLIGCLAIAGLFAVQSHNRSTDRPSASASTRIAAAK
jgi:nitrate/nitrite transporter NarK